mmetsp:Transcript_5080/g.17048  ORF Transcript_5080/g.17048 Transcript_5080/m.17048 type:complete len:327 (-) Transcript_5080:769-1749(-)
MTTTAAPKRLMILAFLMKSSSPSLREMELAMHLPWQHLRPASRMWNLEESTIMGRRLTSGSGMAMLRNLVMAATPSSMPSSMLMSSTWAPFSAWCLATSRALSYSLSMMSFLNLADPARLQRSPRLRKPNCLRSTVTASRPEIFMRGSSGGVGLTRGLMLATSCARALMWSGVVPQQPPRRLTRPRSANWRTSLAKASGVWSYPPIALGRPALGYECTWHVSAHPERACMKGSICVAPRAQLRPMQMGFACMTDTQKASVVCPESVRPDWSTMVPEIMVGSRDRLEFSSQNSSMAYRAALALRVSKMVSTRRRCTPPATSAPTCSL